MSIRIGIGLDIFSNRIDPEAQSIYNRIIAIPNGFSNLSRLNFFVKGLKAIYGSLSNVPVCYDAHWIGGVLGSGVGATAGQACARLCSLTVAGDAIQATASAQPLLLMHGGASSDNYWYGSGVNGNACTAPHSTENNITGDWEVILSTQFLTSTANSWILSKRAFGNSQYAIAKLTLGTFYITQSIGGVDYNITCVSNIGTSFNGFVKITRNATTGQILLYTSLNGLTYNLQSTNSGQSGTLDTIITPLKVGADAGSFLNAYQGNIKRVTISNTIGGAPVVDFNPAQYTASTSQTQWTSSTGEVWTINQSTGQTLHGCIVDRSTTQSAGTTYSMAVAIFAANQPYTEYVMANRIGTGNFIARATGNLRGHDATNYSLNNGTLLSLANTSRNRQLLTYRSNGASSGIAVNNGTETLGNAGTNNGTDLTILQGAHIINTIVQTNIEDTVPQRLAMFNLLKSINNL